MLFCLYMGSLSKYQGKWWKMLIGIPRWFCFSSWLLMPAGGAFLEVNYECIYSLLPFKRLPSIPLSLQFKVFFFFFFCLFFLGGGHDFVLSRFLIPFSYCLWVGVDPSLSPSLFVNRCTTQSFADSEYFLSSLSLWAELSEVTVKWPSTFCWCRSICELEREEIQNSLGSHENGSRKGEAAEQWEQITIGVWIHLHLEWMKLLGLGPFLPL